MKEQNNRNITTPRRPFGMTIQRARSHRRTISSDDSAGGPIIARLRARAYRERKRKNRFAGLATKSVRHFPQHARGLLNLGRQYYVQARDNFSKEAVLFCIILIFAVAWPAIISLRALAG